MKKYNVEFSDKEKSLFNTIENSNMRFSTMAVYALMINNLNNNVCNLSYKQIIGKLKRRYKISVVAENKKILGINFRKISNL